MHTSCIRFAIHLAEKTGYTGSANEATIELNALEGGNAILRAMLEDYVKTFDDNSISDSEMKLWLDYKWIPRVRTLLTSTRPA